MLSATEKAKDIRLLILDVDGILTSAHIFYCNQGNELKAFHVHDGLGMRLLQKSGIPIAVISAKKSLAVEKRLADLNVQHVYLGYENKLPVYEELKEKLHLTDNAIAYMGDDLPDLPILRRAGLAMTVEQAPDIIREHVDLIVKKSAGQGAVREACEFILAAQNKLQPMLQSYLE